VAISQCVMLDENLVDSRFESEGHSSKNIRELIIYDSRILVRDSVTDFKEEGLEVDFYLDVDDGQGNIGKDHDSKNFTERKELLSEIISKVNVELYKDVGYRNFKSEMFELGKKAASLSTRLTKYVENYVSIVDI